MSSQLLTEHGSIRTCNIHLITAVMQAADKTLPSLDILYFIKIKRLLFPVKFYKNFQKKLKIFRFKLHQTIIIKIQIIVGLFIPGSDFLQKRGFTGPA